MLRHEAKGATGDREEGCAQALPDESRRVICQADRDFGVKDLTDD